MIPPLIRQVGFQLQMLEALLQQLDSPGYRAPVPVLGNSSIGMHVRHILEFYQCLHDGCTDGMVNYDRYHLAMIRIALRATGKEHLVAEAFGVAPSTLRSGRLCVR